MIVAQDEDSRGKRRLARKSTAVSQAIHTSSFTPFVRLLIGAISYVSIFCLFCKNVMSDRDRNLFLAKPLIACFVRIKEK
ncbi:hypothetical protein C3744_05515 [Priestia megaterium]|uniref:Uncharacterized protein n=1 Tax=Priestia megaterium TaxID=1404 RepID=A0A3D8X9G7_PRIMG|nr:hypothetical protein C3744_05515 [Priestia megaterium]